MVMESHEKVMEFHFQISVGTLLTNILCLLGYDPGLVDTGSIEPSI